MMGLDDETEEDDLIEAAKRMKEKCAAAGLTPSEVIAPLPGAAPVETISDAQPLTPDPELEP